MHLFCINKYQLLGLVGSGFEPASRGESLHVQCPMSCCCNSSPSQVGSALHASGLLACLHNGDLLHFLLFSNTLLLPLGRAGSAPAAAQGLAICSIHSLKMQCLASSMCVLLMWPLCCAELAGQRTWCWFMHCSSISTSHP